MCIVQFHGDASRDLDGELEALIWDGSYVEGMLRH